MKKCKYKYGDGSKKVRLPIETTDKRKVQAYNDSLTVYKDNTWNYNEKGMDNLVPISKENKLIFTNKKGIAPILWQGKKGGAGHPVYKKPEQPYVLKKNKPVDHWNTDKDILAFRETFKKKFGEEPSRDPKIAKYDYEKAIKAGERPKLDSSDGLYHWSSKYKHDDHPNRFVNGEDTKTGKRVIEPLTPKQVTLDTTELPDRNVKPIKGKGGKFARYPKMNDSLKQERESQGSTRMVNGKLLDMKKAKYKKGTKYVSGVQRVQPNNTPDYNNLYDMQARQSAKQQQTSSTIDGIAQPLTTLNPVAGTILSTSNKAGDMAEAAIGKRSDGTTKVGGFAANKAIKGAGVGASAALAIGGPLGMFAAPFAAAGGAAIGGTYGLIKGKSIQRKEGRAIEEAKRIARNNTLQGQISETEDTDAQAYLKKGGKQLKYKTEARIIETEGREPIFSPKDSSGNRKLLYYNPQGKNHSEGGEKIAVTKTGEGNSIPAGSAIITADNNKNKKAIFAYKNGDKNKLEKIINSMPEDTKNKKAKGTDYTKPLEYYPSTRTGKAKGYKGKRNKASQLKVQEDANAVAQGKKTRQEFINKHGQAAFNHQQLRLDAVSKGLPTYKDPKYSQGEYLSGIPGVKNTNNPNSTLLPNPNQPNGGFKTATSVGVPTPVSNNANVTGTGASQLPQGEGMNYLSNIPSIAEIVARQSVLNSGIDDVPENYLKLGKYKYASQLDKTLANNQTASNTAKKIIRDNASGNSGNYLSNVSNIVANRFKANNEAVIQDTLGRQNILNANVDLSNKETGINLELKNSYNDQKAQNRAAYQDNTVLQGKAIDSVVDTYKMNNENSKINQIYLNNLKTDNYIMGADGKRYFKNPDGTLKEFKKGVKKIKKYKK